MDIAIPNEMVPNCVTCRGYFEDNGSALMHASASVGIETGRSWREELALYMHAFHGRHAN